MDFRKTMWRCEVLTCVHPTGHACEHTRMCRIEDCRLREHSYRVRHEPKMLRIAIRERGTEEEAP